MTWRTQPRRAVVQALVRHGLRRAVAHRVALLGDALAERARLRRVEFAAMVEIDNGTPVGSVLTGSTDGVDIGMHLRLLQPEKRYVALHTHLSSAAFSDDDAVVLVAREAIQTIAAVGVDGTWYVLSKGAIPIHWHIATVVQLVRATVVALRPPYAALVTAGRLTPDEGKRRILHRVWRVLAPRLGLRYDRVRVAGERGHAESQAAAPP